MSRAMIAAFRGRGWLSLIAWIAATPIGMAADPVAHPMMGDGPPAMLVRDGTEKPWRFAKEKDAFVPGTEILGGLGATIESTNGAVQARFTGNIAKLSPFPILDSTITLREAMGADLAFEMDRGRIDLINAKKSGAATVKVTVRGKTGEISLAEPGTRLVIEMYSRWPKGARFHKKPKESDAPSLALVLIAVQGEVHLKGAERSMTLVAPPGASLLLVDSFGDETPHLEHLDKTPDWIDAKDDELLNKMKANVKAFRDLAQKSSIGEALLEMALSDSEPARRMAVILLGGTDDLEHLGAAMLKTTHPDLRDEGIVVLRHWIGRCRGQDLKLYQALIDKAHFKPGEADVALQLLHSFGPADLEKPETYETLIGLLESDKPLISALAHWHLVRLVPAGKSIAFDPTASKEDRAKVVKAWHELVPAGTVPNHSKDK